ncbi:hypothetical protein ACIA2T_19790 [Amycolatopsis japonica]|uniref:hypothetical protein n=1 Tax=Amycolatopsis japonica TaxID=208439 RepID=UPI003795FED4
MTTPRHLRTREERDALTRANGHRPLNDYGYGWKQACEELDLNPLYLMPEDIDRIVGKPHRDLWDAEGDRVLLPGIISEHATPTQPLSRASETDLRDIAQLNGVTLTEAEWAVIDAVADIGTGYGYAKVVGERLGISPGYVRVHINRVREKITQAA